MKPSIGRIVHLRSQHDRDAYAPAIITKVFDDDRVNLTVFPDCAMPFWAMDVEHGDGPVQWTWPPHVS